MNEMNLNLSNYPHLNNDVCAAAEYSSSGLDSELPGDGAALLPDPRLRLRPHGRGLDPPHCRLLLPHVFLLQV